MSEGLPKVMEVGLAEKKPLKICFIYSRIPFPMMRGDQLTVAHLISFLSARGHQVDFVSLETDGHLTSSQSEWLESHCRKVVFIKYGKLAKLFNLLKGALKFLPLQVALFSSKKQLKAAALLDKEEPYDLVYTYYLRSAEIGKQFKGRNILALQLSQYLNTARIADNSTNPLKKIIYSIEARLIRNYECEAIKEFEKVGIIGEKDLEYINKVLSSKNRDLFLNYFYSAHGTDINRFKIGLPEDIIPNRIVFSGNMSYEPNVQAAIWFVENCFAEIKKKIPDVQLYLVGKEPQPSLVKLASEAIVVTGTVPDPYDYIKTAAVCINPVMAAGGMQNKLIEYLASGKVTVATSIANEGIKAPDEALILADSPAQFITSITDILENPTKYTDMARLGRKYVEENWTWEHHFMQLEKEFYTVAGSS